MTFEIFFSLFVGCSESKKFPSSERAFLFFKSAVKCLRTGTKTFNFPFVPNGKSTLLYPRFEKVGGILVYICPSFRPSVRPSVIL